MWDEFHLLMKERFQVAAEQQKGAI